MTLERLLLAIRNDPTTSSHRQVEIDAELIKFKQVRAQQIAKVQLLREALDCVADRIYVKDIDARFLYNNRAHLDALGVKTPEEALGKMDRDFRPANYAQAAYQDDMHVILTGQPVVNREEIRNSSNGEVQIKLASKYPIRDDKGNIMGLVGVTRDITDKKQLEDKLYHAQRLESIGILAGGVAHDFNNILTPILGFSSILLTQGLTAEQNGHMQTVLKSATRAKNLTRQLLQFGRRDAESMTPIKISDTIYETAKLLSGTFTGQHISLDISADQDLYLIDADPTKLNQVIMNLCLNAKDAMPNGGILQITARNKYLDESYASRLKTKPGDYVLMTVCDTGTGMTAEVQKHIFDPFFTTKSKDAGTGLGLLLVDDIVKSHDGVIELESAIGSGTTFSVYLPKSTRTYSDLSIKQSTILRGRGMVLVVDDEDSVREVGMLTLQTLGYTSLGARNGEEALDIITKRGSEINGVILDMQMPGWDGKQTYGYLKQIKPDLRVLLASGRADAQIVSETLALGARAVIAKPYELAGFSKSVYDLLH